jgi:hypothetical protein
MNRACMQTLSLKRKRFLLQDCRANSTTRRVSIAVWSQHTFRGFFVCYRGSQRWIGAPLPLWALVTSSS